MSASLCCTLLFIGLFKFVSAELKNITAESGQNITLPCRAPDNNIPTIGVEWSRADLKPQYVLFFRDDQFDSDNQHPSFTNRVDLQDRQMKDGDVSLILKNVTINDTGTYECEVFQRARAHLKLIIYLSVVPPGPPGQENTHAGLIAGLSVLAVLLVAGAAVFLIYRKNANIFSILLICSKS